MEEVILKAVSGSPAIAMVLMSMGGLRLFLKPIMAYVEYRVAQSPEKQDDERLAKIKASKLYQAIAFIIDYAASVKLPK